MTQNNFFISHSSKDSQLVNKIVEFLKLTLSVDRSTVYCTSGTGTRNIGTGDNFINNIQANVIDTKMVIFIFTPNYFKSNFCLAELGAAWVLNSNIYPIIIPPFDRIILGETPLGTATQTLTLDTYKDLVKMVGEFANQGIGKPDDPGYVIEAAEDLMKWINENYHPTEEKTYTKEEYLTLQKEVDKVRELNKNQVKEIETLKGQNHELLEIKTKEEAVAYQRQVSNQWNLFEEYVKEVRATLSNLDDIVVSAIFHDLFYRRGHGFTPATPASFHWAKVAELKADKLLDVDETTMYPEYGHYQIEPAFSKLKELQNFISNKAEENVFDIFKEQNKFDLDMSDRKLWTQVFGANIYI
ncbi:toll/interleukin-1 receptor domain-containing protein [Bacillus cereus]|uniref:TIR domain-containing protein n=1 Tax=Bacillus cereus TaxID=1396 RepID=A0A9X8NSU6_BACCE|nr:toll/interleukin-1 receptor domain-containing protein [Bacillus cereus]RWQ69852.1 TIR domain-containing protein [Bacillus cereus]